MPGLDRLEPIWQGGRFVGYNEQETRFYLIDPVLRAKGYNDHQWLKLETPAPVEPSGAKGRRRKGAGRTWANSSPKVAPMRWKRRHYGKCRRSGWRVDLMRCGHWVSRCR